MRELIDDRTVITRDSTHCACIFFRDATGLWPIPTSWFSWAVAQDGSRYLTLGEIREIARQHLPDNPIYVLLESPHQGDLFCTGFIPDEFRWRRWGITAGFERRM